VHEETADRVHPRPAGFVLAAVHAVGDAHRLGARALEGELGRVLENQDGALGRGEPITRGLEVAGQDLCLADPVVGEEAIGALRVGPVLAHERQAAADRPVHPLDQLAQALAQAGVGEGASGEFAFPPRSCCRVHKAPHPQAIRCQTRNHARFHQRKASSADVGN